MIVSNWFREEEVLLPDVNDVGEYDLNSISMNNKWEQLSRKLWGPVAHIYVFIGQEIKFQSRIGNGRKLYYFKNQSI